jgi:DNA modification methylase
VRHSDERGSILNQTNKLSVAVRNFFASQDFVVKFSRKSGTFTVSHTVAPRFDLENLDAQSVIEYARARGFTGSDDFDPEPSNALPVVPKQFADFSASGVFIRNCDYKKFPCPEGALTVTDSPYGVGYKYDRHDDRMTDEQWLEMMNQVQRPCVVILPWQKAYLLVSKWGMPDDQVVWTYHSGYRGHQHRLILWFGCKPDMTRPEVGQEFVDKNGRWAKKALANGRTLALRSHHWHIEQVMSGSKEKTAHPCQIPEEVMRLIVLSTAMPGQPIFDPFTGSGTTGVIARRFGYLFSGTDLSADYCEIAKNRIMAVVPPAVTHTLPVLALPPALPMRNVTPFVLPATYKEVNLYNRDYRPASFPAGSLIVSDPPFGIGFKGYDVYEDSKSDADWLATVSGIQGQKAVLILPWERTCLLIQKWGMPDYLVTWVYNSNQPKQSRLITWWGCKPDLSRPEVGQDYKNLGDPRNADLIDSGRKARRYDWWYVNTVKGNSKQKTAHPCQVPEEVIRLIIQSTATKGQHICDPFLGSGTTGVVAKRYGHPFSGWDISAAYVEIARERIAKESGDDAGSSKKAA